MPPSGRSATVAFEKPGNYASNDVLGHLSDYLFHFALVDNDVKLVDFHNPMNRINETVQQTEPGFTLCGRDRMHPDDVGHLVMAYLFLRAQGVNPVIYDVEINAAEGRVVKAEQAHVGMLDASPVTISFSMTAGSLPFPLLDGWQRVLEIVPFAETLNRSSLKLMGIPEGRYALSVDGEAVGEYSSQDLAAGIDLAANERTPAYKQARAVLDLALQWFEITRKMRNAAYGERTVRGKKADLSDDASVQAAIAPVLENPNTRGYVKGFMNDFLEVRQKRAEMEAEIARIEKEMRAGAKPVSHRYELKRLP